MANGTALLLVEQNEGDTLLFKRALFKLPTFFQLKTVRNALEAMNYLEGSGRYRDRNEFPLPDTVLVNLKLPGIDGLEVLDWIRSQPALATLRVIAVVTPESIRDAARAYQLGADSFLVKPDDIEDPSCLQRALRCLRPRRPSVPSNSLVLSY